MTLLNALGYAGLLPFALLPLAYYLQWQFATSPLLQLYQLYSALILGFMAGVLWPVLGRPMLERPVLYQAENGTSGSTLALLAVSFPVISIVALALLPGHFLLLQALLFVLLRIAEFATGINQHYSNSYRSLRNALTLVVCVSHLLMYVLINMPL